MKQITIYELRDLVAEKVGLNCKAENFKDFKEFIDDIYSQFGLRWESIDEQAYRWHNSNIADRNVCGNTELMKSVFTEADSFLHLTEGDADFIGDFGENEPCETVSSIDDVTAEKTWINYVDEQGISLMQTLEFWQKICEKHSGLFKIEVGELGALEGYCELKLEWDVTANKMEPIGCFLEIEDDGGAKLMDSLYWLCECFNSDTFADFEKLGVELRYFVSNEAEGLL